MDLSSDRLPGADEGLIGVSVDRKSIGARRDLEQKFTENISGHCGGDLL